MSMMVAMLGLFLAPIVIGSILGFDISNNVSGWCLLCIFWFIVIAQVIDDDKKLNKIKIACFIIGIFSSSVIAFDSHAKNSPQKSSSNVPSANYQIHQEHSANHSSYNTHSNLHYNHSATSSYAYSDKLLEDKKIRNETETSSSSEIIFSADWEYVTNDERGNKYYIHTDFPVSIYGKRDSGLIFTAHFKKVYSDMGRNEVLNELRLYYQKELPEMFHDLSYAEIFISFKETNGDRKRYVYEIAEYTSDNSIILSWRSPQMKFEWKIISDEVYDTLFDAAYSHL